MKSTISSKGQVTQPIEVRVRLGLAAGTPVRFELKDDAVVLRKGTAGPHPVDRLYGCLRLEKSRANSGGESHVPSGSAPKVNIRSARSRR